MQTDNNAKSTNAEQPAFPVDRDRINMNHTGITKREYFAAIAMQGLLSRHTYKAKDGGDITPELIANDAITMADALLEKLNDH